MAVVYQYSTLLTDGAQDGVGNLTPNMQKMNAPSVDGAVIRVKYGECYVPTDTVSEGPNVFALARFKSNDRLWKYHMGSSGVDPSDGALRWDTGVYKVNTNGTIGDLVGDQYSISRINSEDAVIMGSGNGIKGVINLNGSKAVWEYAGYSSDPGGDLYLCATNFNADVNNAVTCRFMFEYTCGD